MPCHNDSFLAITITCPYENTYPYINGIEEDYMPIIDKLKLNQHDLYSTLDNFNSSSKRNKSSHSSTQFGFNLVTTSLKIVNFRNSIKNGCTKIIKRVNTNVSTKHLNKFVWFIMFDGSSKEHEIVPYLVKKSMRFITLVISVLQKIMISYTYNIWWRNLDIFSVINMCQLPIIVQFCNAYI